MTHDNKHYAIVWYTLTGLRVEVACPCEAFSNLDEAKRAVAELRAAAYVAYIKVYGEDHK